MPMFIDETTALHGETPSSISLQQQTLPIEVIVLTSDCEIKGYVHVSRASKEDRRISDLLNNPEKRFLALTHAELVSRHTPSSPRHYAFIQIHVNAVHMLHPSGQTLLNQAKGSGQFDRYNELRQKIREL